jgi:hypothetical protein
VVPSWSHPSVSDVRLGGHHRRGMIHGKAFAITLAAGVILTLAVSASAHGDQWPDSPPPQSVAAPQTDGGQSGAHHPVHAEGAAQERRADVVMRTRPGGLAVPSLPSDSVRAGAADRHRSSVSALLLWRRSIRASCSCLLTAMNEMPSRRATSTRMPMPMRM